MPLKGADNIKSYLSSTDNITIDEGLTFFSQVREQDHASHTTNQPLVQKVGDRWYSYLNVMSRCCLHELVAHKKCRAQTCKLQNKFFPCKAFDSAKGCKQNDFIHTSFVHRLANCTGANCKEKDCQVEVAHVKLSCKDGVECRKGDRCQWGHDHYPMRQMLACQSSAEEEVEDHKAEEDTVNKGVGVTRGMGVNVEEKENIDPMSSDKEPLTVADKNGADDTEVACLAREVDAMSIDTD